MSDFQGADKSPVFNTGLNEKSAGVYVYAAGSIAAGILDLIWRDFEAAHQPIQALSDHIPGRQILACIAAIWLIAGGTAILLRPTARKGAMVLVGIYSIFGLFWLPRFYAAPHALGFHAGVFIGLLAGVGQQGILVAAAAAVYTSLTRGRSELPIIVRYVFGLSAISFGLAHMTGMQAVTAMVPKWMPLGGDFWTILTGTAFVLAGIAILAGFLDVLAARLLALMLFVFSALVLAPRAFAHPHNHMPWGSNAYNLAAVGAFLICAEALATRRAAANEEPALCGKPALNV